MCKYIKGSWFEFQHHNKAEGKYWNESLASFTSQQWDLKLKEMAELGMEYIVLMATALDYEAYYNTDIFPKAKLKCENPIETILNAADKYGVKIFIGGGFYGDWTSNFDSFHNKDVAKIRLRAINELAEKFGHHKSFYGWYWPNEAFINKYYDENFIKYVNELSREGRKLIPKGKIIIAPYGTRVAIPDDKYVSQLESMDVDIVAYQDEIGVRKTKLYESEAFFSGLRKAHDKVPQVAMWADVEFFEFEGEVYKSALLPAAFERVKKQMEAVSPYVDNILIYQYQGMMNKPCSSAFAGHPDSVKLYSEYLNWLNENHRHAIKF